MKFDLILSNPPFQDTAKRGKTPHKLWIDFTKRSFGHWLKPGGWLAQVSPSSFRSPNSPILEIFKSKKVHVINFDSGDFFPGIGSSFADYVVENSKREPGFSSVLKDREVSHNFVFSDQVIYLPNRIEPECLSVHSKVMFDSRERLPVRWDYVTCHNIRLKTTGTLSKEPTDEHVYPVLHTNSQVWWSSLRQEWSDQPKVMWSRSGFTKPFLDEGRLGGTDMVYFVIVSNLDDGRRLEQILNSKLFKYIYATAKWSGFGNERVFALLPKVEADGPITDQLLFDYFDLDQGEIQHICHVVG